MVPRLELFLNTLRVGIVLASFILTNYWGTLAHVLISANVANGKDSDSN